MLPGWIETSSLQDRASITSSRAFHLDPQSWPLSLLFLIKKQFMNFFIILIDDKKTWSIS